MNRKIRLGIAPTLPLAITAWGCNGEQIESGAKATAKGLERAGRRHRVGHQEPGREAQGNRHGLEARRGRGHDRRGHREGGEKTREVLDKTGEKLKEVAPAAGKAVDKAGEKLSELKDKAGEAQGPQGEGRSRAQGPQGQGRPGRGQGRREAQGSGRQGQGPHQQGNRQELTDLALRMSRRRPFGRVRAYAAL